MSGGGCREAVAVRQEDRQPGRQGEEAEAAGVCVRVCACVGGGKRWR